MPHLTKANDSHDIRHWLTVMTVFGITGISALVFSRVLFNGMLDLEGSLWSGPWSYRVLYLSVIPPFYSVTLVLVGAIFGKREYFAARVFKMWGRLIPGRVRRRFLATLNRANIGGGRYGRNTRVPIR